LPKLVRNHTALFMLYIIILLYIIIFTTKIQTNEITNLEYIYILWKKVVNFITTETKTKQKPSNK